MCSLQVFPRKSILVISEHCWTVVFSICQLLCGCWEIFASVWLRLIVCKTKLLRRYVPNPLDSTPESSTVIPSFRDGRKSHKAKKEVFFWMVRFLRINISFLQMGAPNLLPRLTSEPRGLVAPRCGQLSFLLSKPPCHGVWQPQSISSWWLRFPPIWKLCERPNGWTSSPIFGLKMMKISETTT